LLIPFVTVSEREVEVVVGWMAIGTTFCWVITSFPSVAAIAVVGKDAVWMKLSGLAAVVEVLMEGVVVVVVVVVEVEVLEELVLLLFFDLFLLKTPFKPFIGVWDAWTMQEIGDGTEQSTPCLTGGLNEM
jgi:hypothetical protein